MDLKRDDSKKKSRSYYIGTYYIYKKTWTIHVIMSKNLSIASFEEELLEGG